VGFRRLCRIYEVVLGVVEGADGPEKTNAHDLDQEENLSCNS